MHPNYKVFLILLVLLFALYRESKAQDRSLTIENAVHTGRSVLWRGGH
ncbi:MAG TPA: hypothetical protein VF646_14160 [Cytophagales bacterium]|jgi:hypothetical protein